MKNKGSLLDAAAVRSLLFEIGERLAEEGQAAEIVVFGGSALLLTMPSRLSTKDVDYVAASGDRTRLQAISDEVGLRRGLGEGWLNDAVSIFVSGKPDHRLVGDFPPERPGLRVFVASPRYMLAMKLMAMRSPFETNDMRDIWDLLDHCGINGVDEAVELLSGFYPDHRIPHHKELILSDLIEAKERGSGYSPMLAWSS